MKKQSIAELKSTALALTTNDFSIKIIEKYYRATAEMARNLCKSMQFPYKITKEILVDNQKNLLLTEALLLQLTNTVLSVTIPTGTPENPTYINLDPRTLDRPEKELTCMIGLLYCNYDTIEDRFAFNSKNESYDIAESTLDTLVSCVDSIQKVQSILKPFFKPLHQYDQSVGKGANS
jgi:hypothetical protein